MSYIEEKIIFSGCILIAVLVRILVLIFSICHFYSLHMLTMSSKDKQLFSLSLKFTLLTYLQGANICSLNLYFYGISKSAFSEWQVHVSASVTLWGMSFSNIFHWRLLHFDQQCQVTLLFHLLNSCDPVCFSSVTFITIKTWGRVLT